MKKFADYLKLKEVSALNIGKQMLGGASSLNLDAKSQGAFDAVMGAFELVLGSKPNVAISWLKNVVNTMPEVKDEVESLMSQHDIENLKDTIPAVRRAGQKIGRSISRGLGDMDSGSSDVVAMNSSDSMS